MAQQTALSVSALPGPTYSFMAKEAVVYNPAASRTFNIWNEDRTYQVDAENRTYVVPEDDRTVKIE